MTENRLSRANISKYDLLMLVTTVVWGFNFPIVKAAIAILDPHLFNALRFSISVAAIGLFDLLRSSRGPDNPRIPISDYVKMGLIGLLGHVVYQITFIEGLTRTTSGASALLIASAPLWIAVFGRIARVERLTIGAWLALLVAFAGTVMVALHGSGEMSGTRVAGNFLTLTAAAAWAGATVVSKPLLNRISAIRLTFFGMSMAMPVLWLFALPAIQTTQFSAVPPTVWLAVLYSGGLSTGIAYVFWNVSVKHIGPTHTGAYGNLVPVVGLLAGYLLLGEPLLPLQLVGGALVLSGLIAMRRIRMLRRRQAVRL